MRNIYINRQTKKWSEVEHTEYAESISISDIDFLNLKSGKSKLDFNSSDTASVLPIRNVGKKKKECQEVILSKYSFTDQINMLGTVMFEREVLGEVSEQTLNDAKSMYGWIKAVQDEFRTNGSDADFTQFQ